MTDAERTIKFAIFQGITSNWHNKSDQHFAAMVRDSVFESIFAPHLKWALEEYLKEISQTKPIH